jgi:hypothetical protein
MLELIHVSPNWRGALSVALVRPTGVPERRHGEDPWQRGRFDLPRRLTDDLAWLRVALENPEPNGLKPLPDRDVVVAWVPDAHGFERLRRLRDRAVLEAAGFLLFEDEAAATEPRRPPRLARAGRSSSAGRAPDL